MGIEATTGGAQDSGTAATGRASVKRAAGAAGGSSFGRMLRELRQSHGLTMEELAEASGVSGRAIGDMERGRSLRPHRGTVTALAQGLRLDEAAHNALLAEARATRFAAKATLSVKPSPYALPRGVRDFVGRHAELSVLRALAQRAAEESEPQEQGRRTAAPPVAVVCGAPGSGKTTLAVRLAEEFAPAFPDGALLLDMRGLEEQPLSAEEAMLRLLGAWGVEVAQVSAEERLACYQATAAGLRAVLVLDNAGSEAQVRPLLPRAGGCARGGDQSPHPGRFRGSTARGTRSTDRAGVQLLAACRGQRRTRGRGAGSRTLGDRIVRSPSPGLAGGRELGRHPHELEPATARHPARRRGSQTGRAQRR
ncbi:helix-turn-helix domain-containing protein [Streptomyces sp. SID13588]|nr:helix-turn-helix domain-containing protein [Streptomyces sp. SID13588]